MTQRNPDRPDADEIVLARLPGMNTSAPLGSTDQPDLLENLTFDRRGGYTVAPSPAARLTSHPVQRAIYFGPGNRLMLDHGASFPAVCFDLDNDLETEALNWDGYPTRFNLVNYGPGLALSYTTGVGYTFYYEGGAFVVDEPIVALSSLTFTFSALATSLGVAPAALGNGGWGYIKGSVPGFNANRSHWVLLFVEPYTTAPDGTSVSPATPIPNTIRPYLLKLPKAPTGGGNAEYRFKVDGLGGRVYAAWGVAYPETYRLYNEWWQPTGSYFAWAPATAVTLGTVAIDIPEDGNNAYKFVCTKAGNTGASRPAWTRGYGTTVTDGTATWQNQGAPDGSNNDTETFDQYIAAFMTQDAPIHLYPPGFTPYPYKDFAQWQWRELHVDSLGWIYRAAAETPKSYISQFAFLPLGRATEWHLDRLWVVGESYVQFVYDGGFAASASVQDRIIEHLEVASRPRTLYYSEPQRPADHRERYVVLPFRKSEVAVSVRSLGDTLIAHGDADAVVVYGDSEANFRYVAIDIPGAYTHATTCVLDGVYYWRGPKGFYRLAGGRAEEVSLDVADRFNGGGWTESLSVDRLNRRIYLRFDDDSVLVYDTRANAWCEDTQGLRPVAPGTDLAISVSGGVLSTVDGPPLAPGRVRWPLLDAGNFGLRKSYTAVSFLAETDGEPDPAPAIEVHAAVPDRDDAPRGTAQVQRIGPHYFRLRDCVGWGLRLTLVLNPAGQRLTLHPGLRLEVSRYGVERSGYGH